MGTELQKAPQSAVPETIQKMLESRRVDIQELLPAHIDVNRFIKSALLAVARNNTLKQCTPVSLFTAVVNAAELGLDFTPAKGHAYLVPYGKEATFMPGYRGLAELAIRGGKVAQIWSYIVYEHDEFSIVYGTIPDIKHVPLLTGNKGKIVGAYSVARFKDGTVQFEYMDYEQLMAIKKRSKAANNGPWVTDEGEMIRKTVMRRLYKYLPSSPDLEKAIELDNAAVGFVTESISDDEPGVSRTSKLADMIGDEPDPNRVEVEQPKQSDKPSPEPPSSEPVTTEGPKMYGSYVRMTQKDYDTLVARYHNPESDEAIDALNTFLETNADKRGDDHYAMLCRNMNKKNKSTGTGKQESLL